MAPAQAGPGFFGNPVEPARGASIDDLLAPRRQIVEQRLLVADQRRVEPRREAPTRRVLLLCFSLPPLCLPLWQTAVAERDIVVSEEAPPPPRPTGPRQAPTCI